jgi:NAD(P)-dependent dehydrogenase (short-subunit alcohol dehydrogenase family)
MVFMDLSLKGKRAVVTAGAGGIGRAIADTFVKNGARVQVCDVDEKALAGLPKEIFQLKADVAAVADVERLFAEAQKNLGGLDILVNNAGIAGPTGRVEDIDPKDWDRCIAVDLNGMFYCTRKAMPMIKAAGGGSIVNLSSIAGRFGFPLRTPYSAAKWAVIGFTQSIAAEAGPDGVRCNAIQPGIVEGDRVESIMEAKAKSLGVTRKEIRDRMVEGISLKTTVTAQDVADTIHFLVSDAGKHISAQTIGVCGGARYLV